MTGLFSGVPPDHILVFIPGFLGSKLRNRSTGELVWLDIPSLLLDPIQLQEKMHSVFEQLKYPNEDLVADSIMDQIVFFPPLLKQDEYGSILRTLTSWGYILNSEHARLGQKPAYIFPYDWRQDNRISAHQLAEAIESWRLQHPGAEVWLLAHSNGGTIARWYIENEGGKEVVSRLLLVGAPWDGAPKSLEILLNGVDWFLLRSFNRFGLQKWVSETARTFPCFYQLLPGHLPFLREEDGRTVDIFEDPNLPGNDLQKTLLSNARDFNQELDTNLSVETLCFFGIKQPTTSQGVVKRSSNGKIQVIVWQAAEDGDGTVPVHSALHPLAKERLPFSAGHGDLYTHRPLLDKLHFELVSRYRYGMAAEPAACKYHAKLTADQSAYSPRQTIHLSAQLTNLETGLPISNARVKALLAYRGSVIGAAPTEIWRIQRSAIVVHQLIQNMEVPGEYCGDIQAPDIEGYYLLRLQFLLDAEPPFELQDLILVDQVN